MKGNYNYYMNQLKQENYMLKNKYNSLLYDYSVLQKKMDEMMASIMPSMHIHDISGIHFPFHDLSGEPTHIHHDLSGSDMSPHHPVLNPTMPPTIRVIAPPPPHPYHPHRDITHDPSIPPPPPHPIQHPMNDQHGDRCFPYRYPYPYPYPYPSYPYTNPYPYYLDNSYYDL
jgi:hypothetical protein